MKTLLTLGFSTVPLLAAGVALAQTGNMMDGSGWGMGGYGGIWGPIILVIVIAGVVALVMQRKGK